MSVAKFRSWNDDTALWFNFFVILFDPICNVTKVTGALRNGSSEVWNSKLESYQFANYSGGEQKYTCNRGCCTPTSSSKRTSMPEAGRGNAREATSEPHGWQGAKTITWEKQLHWKHFSTWEETPRSYLCAAGGAVWEIHILWHRLQHDPLLHCQTWLSQLSGSYCQYVLCRHLHVDAGTGWLACWMPCGEDKTCVHLHVSTLPR